MLKFSTTLPFFKNHLCHKNVIWKQVSDVHGICENTGSIEQNLYLNKKFLTLSGSDLIYLFFHAFLLNGYNADYQVFNPKLKTQHRFSESLKIKMIMTG